VGEWSVGINWVTAGGFPPGPLEYSDLKVQEGALVLFGATLGGQEFGSMGIPLDRINYWTAKRSRRSF
jgi:hypothetical protein